MKILLNQEVKTTSICILLLLIVCIPSFVYGKIIMTEQAALERAFPGMKINKRNITLTKEQIDIIQKAAQSKQPSPELIVYEAFENNVISGRAYIDTHIVRTETETILTVVKPNGQLKMVLVLTFLDHPDYISPPRWLKKFNDKQLNESLQRDKEVPNMVGATLTVDALVGAVRRALAVNELIEKGKVK